MKKPSVKENLFALRQCLDAFLEAVKAGGELGVPEGIIYTALMTAGGSLKQYETMRDILVEAGRIRKAGNLLFILDGK